jgi:hypothetical protein
MYRNYNINSQSEITPRYKHGACLGQHSLAPVGDAGSARCSDRWSTKTMTEDQFDRVVDAIALGKYSWACLLILRFAGYNPLHYIPHRTYNRLMKSYRENKLEPVEEIETTFSNRDRSKSKATV